MNWSFSQVSWNWPFHSKKDLLHLNPPRAPTFPASSKSSYKATHPCVQTCWPEITSWSFHDGSTWIQGGVTSGSPAVAHRTLHSSEGSGDMERVSPGLRSVWDKRRGEGGGCTRRLYFHVSSRQAGWEVFTFLPSAWYFLSPWSSCDCGWKSSRIPRRCCNSSFRLVGTNVKLLLVLFMLFYFFSKRALKFTFCSLDQWL